MSKADTIVQDSMLMNGYTNNFLINGFMPTYSRFTSDNPQKNILWREAYMHMFDVDSSLFKWSGLEDLFEDAPYGDVGTWIEKALLNTYGMLVVFKDDFGNAQIALAGPGMLSTRNFYYQLDTVVPIMPDGTTYGKYIKVTGDDADGVLIENKQYSGSPDSMIMDMEASMIAELRLSQLQNIIAVRNPTVIHSNIWNKEDAKSIEEAVKQGQPLVSIVDTNNKNVLDSGKAPISVGSINPNVSYNFNVMDQSIATTYSRAFSQLGVDAGAGMEKAERLIAAEAEGNESIVQGVLANKLNSRKYSAKKINELFGTNVSVDVIKPVGDDVEPSEMLKNSSSMNKMSDKESDTDE